MGLMGSRSTKYFTFLCVVPFMSMVMFLIKDSRSSAL